MVAILAEEEEDGNVNVTMYWYDAVQFTDCRHAPLPLFIELWIHKLDWTWQGRGELNLNDACCYIEGGNERRGTMRLSYVSHVDATILSIVLSCEGRV